MYFDTVIIGGGLSGLTAGLRLLRTSRQRGKQLTCALVNAGQGALHFSSGSFDFCNALPDDIPVAHIGEALPSFFRWLPSHPYALLGEERLLYLAREAESLFQELNMGLVGSLAEGNHFRLSPLGRLVPAWLSCEDSCTVPMGRDGTPQWPWKRVLVGSIEGYLDCPTEAVGHALRKAGLEVTHTTLGVPELERRRSNSSEFRSTTIAQVLDKPATLALVAEQLAPAAAHADVVLLPACLGAHSAACTLQLAALLGKPVRLIPTMPPSLPGARLNTMLLNAFIREGGVLLPGDQACGFGWAAPETSRVSHVHTVNLEDDPLRAEYFLLASGSFFSKGLAATRHRIREPIFDLDLIHIPQHCDQRQGISFFADQPFARVGARTDGQLRGYAQGKPLANVYVAGMLLGGVDALRLGCGAGVAVTSALAAADAILEHMR